jgi:hypothetical protein
MLIIIEPKPVKGRIDQSPGVPGGQVERGLCGLIIDSLFMFIRFLARCQIVLALARDSRNAIEILPPGVNFSFTVITVIAKTYNLETGFRR